jgi:hypothetical protein
VTAKGYKFSFGNDENIIELGEWWQLHSRVNILQNTELNTLKWWLYSLWINLINKSSTLQKKKKKKTAGFKLTQFLNTSPKKRYKWELRLKKMLSTSGSRL